MNKAIQANNFLARVFVIVTIFSLSVSGLKYAVTMLKFNSVKQEPNSAPPEQVLAVKDGLQNTPEAVQPYSQRLDQLESKCTENRLQLAGIGLTIAKKEREQGMNLSAMEGLDTLLYEASLRGDGKTSCMDAYLDWAN